MTMSDALSPVFWYRNGKATPMVPCDGAAVERVARALDRAYDRHEMTLIEVARDVLRAAGETP